ncbi:MAG: homocysteine S-methyltransferase family protein [Rhodospirillaceae bacterium]|nr:homocysteine S-methyltransferase family protein [Rhodospirillaceae bacterium]MBL6930050.1 homocysteine S-methyltransferase family protein [Rhodospirillales bacterium]MBL6941969.1 homocysteine S-methyltransferase family protein [Rhodospirillales bacterium]
MAEFRNNLPQLEGGLFLTDGGIETTLIFHEGIDLPHFASFDLLREIDGKEALRKQFASYAAIARDHGVGCILETPTWRASSDWGDKMGYSKVALGAVNKEAVSLLMDIRKDYQNETTPIVICGGLGPRGDGYVASEIMSADQAQRYHAPQVAALCRAGADLIGAMTMTNTGEAIGVTRAAMAEGIPVVISFTVETDGLLPTGQSLKDAITEVDAVTDNAPVYYMINCAHPTHFQHLLDSDEDWLLRLRGICANASCMSHAELDAAEELDDGSPVELAGQFKNIRGRQKHINVLGGCCGTDSRHIDQIGHHCKSLH